MTLRTNASKAILMAFLSILPLGLIAVDPKLNEGLALFKDGRYGDAYQAYNEAFYNDASDEDKIAGFVGRTCVDLFFHPCPGSFERSMLEVHDMIKYKDKDALLAYIKEHTPYEEAMERYLKLYPPGSLCERCNNPD